LILIADGNIFAEKLERVYKAMTYHLSPAVSLRSPVLLFGASFYTHAELNDADQNFGNGKCNFTLAEAMSVAATFHKVSNYRIFHYMREQRVFDSPTASVSKKQSCDLSVDGVQSVSDPLQDFE